jgi:hypothetical protein
MLALQPLPSHSIQATNAAGDNKDDISVIFLYGATQAMAMTAQASSITCNPQTLDLPSISTLVSFYHACLSFPVKQTWLMPLGLGFATPLMVSHTPTWLDTVPTPAKQP